MLINLRLLSQRLSQARTLLSVTVEDVCSDTGIQPDRLRVIEGGGEAPSGDELLILANYYTRDFRDFIDPDRPEPFKQTDILYRRHGDTFTPSDRRAIQEFLFLCEIEASLQRELRVRHTTFAFVPTSNDLHKVQGPKAAAELRIALGYGGPQIPLDVYSGFRQIGLHVFRRRLVTSEISGLYIEHPGAGHCILVNYEEDIYRQRFSASHEVAHAIFDSGDAASVSYQRGSSKYNPRDLKELRANRFASCYLMPPEHLPNVRQWDTDQALHWAEALNVSTEALSYALLSAQTIDEDTATLIRSVRVSSAEKVDPEAPAHLTLAQQNRRNQLLERGLSDYYVGLCFEAHQQGVISAGRLGEALLADHNETREISVLFGRNVIDGL